MERDWVTLDGNEAAVSVAHQLSDVIAIYPITPSTPMGELADAWSAVNKPNLWGTIPTVVEMQSEGGAAGAIHGAIQSGALATTFTASQGLLLMIPNMYKIAGELTPVVFHVAARALAAQALSIFGDHSDVMSTRATGFALLASSSVQEAQDLALVAHAATFESRVPFLHFFDGFRTSHEVNKIERIPQSVIRAMIDDELVQAHRRRALTPDHPVIRGTAQNPDVYFQGRETVNPYYLACPSIVQGVMDRFAALTGRHYHLFEYSGAPDAEQVIVIMGSGVQTVTQTSAYMNLSGGKTGVLTVHLYRPFAADLFMQALPSTVRSIAVLDRTKEPGSAGEPLYQDVVTAISEAFGAGRAPFATYPRVIGGRYGLGSKEFTPAMVRSIYSELRQPHPRQHFTIGIDDDVTGTSLPYDPAFSIENPETVRCVFYGLGSDGTVGANKNSIKIIGEETDNYAQGYFYYDSKKSGTVTISHLRFGPQPIQAPYLIDQANFVACHQFNFLERVDVLHEAAPGATFLLNSPYGPDEIWEHLPREVQETILAKHLRLFVIDARKVASASGMGARINTVMQTCFFAISGVLPREQAIEEIKKSVVKTYGRKGQAVVQRNFDAIDQTLAGLHEVDVARVSQAELSTMRMREPVAAGAPDFVRNVLGKMVAGRGDDLPVSAMPADGTYPVGTAKWERRNIAEEIPVWDSKLCIQCGKCTFVCPHAAIRMKVYEPSALEGQPETFLSTDARFFREFPGHKYTLQVAPEDCTGCSLCVDACPAVDKKQPGHKAIDMAPQAPLREREAQNWDFFLTLPDMPRDQITNLAQIKNSQLLEPLFEFSGACSGCGETPYIKLVTQLFGDRTVIANATGCSSIFGGNLPTTPWTSNADGRGPAWSNSLFEDNAEFGLGMRLTIDKQHEYALQLLDILKPRLDETLVESLKSNPQSNEADLRDQRKYLAALKESLAPLTSDSTVGAQARELLSVADNLVKRSVWIMGGDGWAYDIGYGGLDHVLASGANVNVLVLDTEVYSNTGGQASKSTPVGAVAKFAANGKARAKKDLGEIAMSYGNIYVARIAMGYSDAQTLRAIMEAEAYDGPSLIIAYSHCINHGIDMEKGMEQQRLAVRSGYWPLYRFNPDLAAAGQNPFILDSKDPDTALSEFENNETRYRMLMQSDPQRAETLMNTAQEDIRHRWAYYKHLAMGTPKSE
jgi:pyruvate-ferredoxin/flavodoxin oxidoreductase